MEKEKRGFLQAMMDAAMKEDVKYGEKGKPRKKMSEREARQKSERDAYAVLEDAED